MKYVQLYTLCFKGCIKRKQSLFYNQCLGLKTLIKKTFIFHSIPLGPLIRLLRPEVVHFLRFKRNNELEFH